MNYSYKRSSQAHMPEREPNNRYQRTRSLINSKIENILCRGRVSESKSTPRILNQESHTIIRPFCGYGDERRGGPQRTSFEQFFFFFFFFFQSQRGALRSSPNKYKEKNR